MTSLSANELFNVKGMVFVITGAGTGIGRMMAKALDENGAAKVYILGRRMNKLEEVAKNAVNRSMVPIKADVTSKEDLSAAAAQIKSEVGWVNCVIANSGISGPAFAGLPQDHTPSISELQDFLWRTPTEEFSETFDVNSTGMFYTMVAFLALLDAGNQNEKSASIAMGVTSQFIAISSISAFSRRLAAGFAYGGSKAAVLHMMKQIATYMVPYHIRANIIAPGLYPSELTEGMFSGDPTKRGTFPETRIPMTRAGTEEDMAGAILSLCGRAGAYYNGFVLVTDGGRLAVLPSTY